MKNISVLVSGGGTNLQSIIDAVNSGNLRDCKISLVISSKEGVYALERAKADGIKGIVVSQKDYGENFADKLLEELDKADSDLVVLAGYLTVLPEKVIKKYDEKIINIHPSLIPKYCGKGYYGMKVHEAVVAAGEKESGATVHFVDVGIDTGSIIIQRKVDVSSDDTAEDVAKKVLEVEHKILIEAIDKVLFARKES